MDESRYSVRFLGVTTYCNERRHAVALQQASDILNEVAYYNLTADQLQDMTCVVLRYGEYDAARRLQERARIYSGADPSLN
jgi:hypothetical protein